MKKLLIATAALAMVAGTAQAQSSVTVYGNIDISFSSNNKDTGTNTTQGSGAGTALSTSLMGLKGTEDLGGGLSAIFDLQADLNTNTGYLGNADSAGTIFSRQAWIGLSDKKLGTLRVGRISDVLDTTEGFANFNQVFDTEAASANGLGGKNGGSTRYDSPTIAGVTFSASYSNGVDAANAGTTSNTGNILTTYGVDYKTGALTVGAANGEAKLSTSTEKGKLSTIYAGYNLGFADVRVQQTTNKAVTVSTTNYTETKTREVSAGIPLPMLGSGVSAVVHYETADVENQAGATQTNSEYKQQGFTLQKDLSKRTTAYVGFRDKNFDGTGADEKVSIVGMKHTF
jgi:predicted porin